MTKSDAQAYRVLIVTNMFPAQRSDIDYYGIFVKEQMDALEGYTPVVCDVFAIDGFKNKWHYILTIPKIYRKISANEYDVVHIHYGISGMFLLALPFRTWSNVVLTLHGGDILSDQNKGLQVFLSKWISRKASRLVVLNNKMKLIADKLNKNIAIIPCGVNTEFFQGARNSRSGDTLLFGGDPARWVKNYPLFESIVAAYRRNFGPVSTASLGSLTRHQVRELLLNSSALVMTSFSEGSPQIVKEAMSCDLSVISSDVGDVCEFLAGTPGTRIFDLDEAPESIALKIHQAINEAAHSEGVRRNRVFEAKIDQESIAKRIYLEYRLLRDEI